VSAPGRTALLLVDLQHDYLVRPGLVPHASVVVERAARLLDGFRDLGLPVVHVHTRTRADGADRMRHWREQDVVACVEGTPGAETPLPLRPRADELVATKQHYRGFADAALDPWLRARDVERVVIAGVYTHACVRETALDAYERGYDVWIGSDAIGSTEPAHAASTRAWLEPRAARFRPVRVILAELGLKAAAVDGGDLTDVVRHPVAVIGGEAIAPGEHDHVVHHDPCSSARVLSEVPLATAEEVRVAAEVAAAARGPWASVPTESRAAALDAWADSLAARADGLTECVVQEVGKPRAAAADEVQRAIGHVRTSVALLRGSLVDDRRVAPAVTVRHRPVGVIGIVMPWNNPLALACGKIAPALAFGNGVVFKPAPEGAATALALLETLADAGIPPGLVNVVMGAAETAEAMVDDPLIDAIAVTGSIATGRALTARCGIARKPLQAELGGNNAAIVLADADLDAVVAPLIRGAFSYAGQRCTAIRRFVVEASVVERFEALAGAVIDELVVGDPGDPRTDVGPLISATARDRVDAVVARARDDGARVLRGGSVPQHLAQGAWYPPTLLATDDRGSAIVQEETFGPVAVVQPAADLDDAFAAADGVEQGLVMAICTNQPDARRRVIAEAKVGIVQVGPGPLPVHPDAPFGGWKASGFGPPEHGEWDAAFATRPQAVYGDAES
jgi:acyl-CoA reductase-like NAD-dependent aldehyde dehydrogenase/nicotinamidase-related amidase